MKQQSRKKLVAKVKVQRRQSGLVSFRIAEHKHTGKLIHHRYTSHFALFGLLIFLGVFMCINKNIVQAYAIGGSVEVGVVVTGNPPTVGAIITSPTDGITIKGDKNIDVKGICLKNSFVVVKNNDRVVGSTTCSSTGVFKLKIQLTVGKNILSALNYDNLNQPGPDSVPVTVTLSTIDTISNAGTSIIAIPSNPSVIPLIGSSSASINPSATSLSADCDSYDAGVLPTGGTPHIDVVCVPRLFGPNLEKTLGIIVWGGTPPYAVGIDWGDGLQNSLLSVRAQGYRKEHFSYKNAGNYNIILNLKDSNGSSAMVQTAVQINGRPISAAGASSSSTASPALIASSSSKWLDLSWLKLSVPIYILMVAATLGFWGGDIFDHYFGDNKKPHHKRRKIA